MPRYRNFAAICAEQVCNDFLHQPLHITVDAGGVQLGSHVEPGVFGRSGNSGRLRCRRLMQGYSGVNGSIRGKVEKGGLFAALSSLRRLHNYCGSTFFSQKLLAGRVQLDQKVGGVDAVHKLVIPQFNIAVARVTGRKGKIFLRVQAGTDGIFQHAELGKARQVAVSAEVLPQLLDLDS